jgi:hypothetical protein
MSFDLTKRPEIIAVLQERQKNEKQKSLLKMSKKKRQKR